MEPIEWIVAIGIAIIIGIFVFRVLLHFAFRHGVVQALRNLGAANALQVLQFILQLLQAFRCEVFLFDHSAASFPQ